MLRECRAHEFMVMVAPTWYMDGEHSMVSTGYGYWVLIIGYWMVTIAIHHRPPPSTIGH
jgi:hypothetical protein